MSSSKNFFGKESKQTLQAEKLFKLLTSRGRR